MGFTALAIAERVGHEAVDITYRYAHDCWFFVLKNCWFFTAENCWFYYTVYKDTRLMFDISLNNVFVIGTILVIVLKADKKYG